MNIEHLYISPNHNFFGHHGKPPGDSPVTSVDEMECEAGRGVVGDRFYDYKPDYDGQITFFSIEVYRELCKQFGVADKDPSVFRRNVLVSGEDLNSLIGQKFEVQGVEFLGTREASPCYWMNQAFHDGAEGALKGRGGLRARIVTSGTLQV